MRPANDNLYIPPFLRGPDRIADTTPLKTKSDRFVKSVPKPPKGKKWEGAELVTIWLADECPKIGCGIRMVWAKRGHKWAHIQEIGSHTRGRLKVETFDRALCAEKLTA